MSEKYNLNGGAVNLGEYGATKSRRAEDKVRMIPDDAVRTMFPKILKSA